MENFPVDNKAQLYNKPSNSEAGYNPTSGPSYEEQAKRVKAKKQQEMEAKLYQDKQIREKKAYQDRMKKVQDDEYKQVVRDVEKFNQEEAQKKIDKLTKNKNHLDLVKKQMQEPRMFAKTGVAIIKNNALPQLPV